MAFQPVAIDIRSNVAPEDRASNRDLYQKGLLRQAFSGALDDKGNVNEKKFYSQATALGLDPDKAAEAMRWRSGQYETLGKMAGTTEALQAMRPGYNPESGLGRAGASIGEPAPVSAPNSDYAGESPTAPSLPQGVATPPAVPDAREQAKARSGAQKWMDGFSRPQPDANTVQITGQAPEATQSPTMQLPELSGSQSPTTLIPGQDNRSAMQSAMDQYIATPSADQQSGVAQDPSAEAPPDAFAWQPVDDGSNQFRQYASALDSQLKAAGIESPEALLRQTYNNTFQQNLAPVPPAALMMTDKAKFYTMTAERRQSVAKARALAEQAVLNTKNELAKSAKEYGVNTVEQAKSELPGDLLLRDPAKRNEASALITNRDNIKYAQKLAADAGEDTSKLHLAYPTVARAYATALNPGQQLSEGNLSEVASSMFPEQSGNKKFMASALMALGRFFKSGFKDTSGLDQLENAIDVTSPGALAERVRRMASEAEILNSRNLQNYVYKAQGGVELPPSPTQPEQLPQAPPAPEAPKKSGAQKWLDETVKKVQKPDATKKPALGSLENPYPEGVEPPVGAHYRYKGAIKVRGK